MKRYVFIADAPNESKIIDFEVAFGGNQENFKDVVFSGNSRHEMIRQMQNEANDALTPIENELKKWDEITRDQLSSLESSLLEE